MRLRGWWLRTKGFAARHAVLLVVIAMTIVGVVAVLGVRAESDARIREDKRQEAVRQREDDRQEAATEAARLERLEQVCTSIDDNRQGLLDFTEVVLADDSPPLRLTAPTPEFQALAENTKAYLRSLEAQDSGSGPSLRDRIEGFRAGLLAQPFPDFCPTEDPP